MQRRIFSLGLIAILAAFQLSALAGSRRNGKEVKFSSAVQKRKTVS